MLILAVSGVCIVIALTGPEFDAAEATDRAPQLLADLRVLGTPLIAIS